MINKLNVFITVDTEIWPQHESQPDADVLSDFQRDILGNTRSGQFGITYQISCLNKYDLKAIFFVDPFFSYLLGLNRLNDIVKLIKAGKQEIQLHLHTEWLKWVSGSILPGKNGIFLKDFTEDEQTFLIGKAIELFKSCSCDKLVAFRAGNYGANIDTLKALKRNNILFDSSYNYCYLNSWCGLETMGQLLQPSIFEGIYEFPITFFNDWLNHFRPLQLNACSSQEIEMLLERAWEEKWGTFVIVLHSFELIKRRNINPEPDVFLIERFNKLCKFLCKNRDRFYCSGFDEIDVSTISRTQPVSILTSNIYYTALRFAEQMRRRLS